MFEGFFNFSCFKLFWYDLVCMANKIQLENVQIILCENIFSLGCLTKNHKYDL